MDYDKLNQEILRLQDLLAKYEDPADEGYMALLKVFNNYTKMKMEYDEACDKQCERQNKLDLEHKRLAQEFELKVKEFELKSEQEAMKMKENQNKLDLERARLSQELDLKIKELELRSEQEAMKMKENSAEACARRKAEKRQAFWDIIKIIVQLIGSAALIFLTGHIEQTAILGNHKWSLIPFLKGKS